MLCTSLLEVLTTSLGFWALAASSAMLLRTAHPKSQLSPGSHLLEKKHFSSRNKIRHLQLQHRIMFLCIKKSFKKSKNQWHGALSFASRANLLCTPKCISPAFDFHFVQGAIPTNSFSAIATMYGTCHRCAKSKAPSSTAIDGVSDVLPVYLKGCFENLTNKAGIRKETQFYKWNLCFYGRK